MANRYPLTLNTSSSTIEELPSGDNLDLSGSNIANVGNISAGNSVSANYFVGTLYGTANLATYATTANSVAGANVSGEVSYAAVANSVAGANVSGEVSYAAVANSVAGANVSGTVSAATTAGTVTTNAQPNITSVGTLTSLTLSGDSNLGPIANVHITGGTSGQLIQTDGTGNLSFATVSGDSYQLKPVRAATTQSITLSGTQTIDGIALSVGDRVLVWLQNATPSTGSVDNGVYIVQSGAWTRTTDFTTGSATLSGGITVAVQSGNFLRGVNFVCTNTSAITIGATAITFERVSNTGLISIWTSGGGSFQGKANGVSGGATAIGVNSVAATDSTAMGYTANASGEQGTAYGYGSRAQAASTVSIGTNSFAGGVNSTAVGRSASATAAGATVIGRGAGEGGLNGADVVAVGLTAGRGSQGANAVAVGARAGYGSQGANSIAIGANAGYTSQASNSIILNATGANLDQTTANTFTVKPIRSATGTTNLYYNATTGEITHAALSVDGLAVGTKIIPQNSQSVDYTLVAGDSGKHILHPSADTTARTFTIPANSSVPYDVGTSVTFVNQASAGNVSIAITTDTMRLAGNGATGTRTLQANGVATAIKITSTEWIISGVNLA